MRLNVFIAKSGFCSRRKADAFIKQGKVTVNGSVIVLPWQEVGEHDAVAVLGERLNKERPVYIIFNKPPGVTVTLKDRFARKKITDYMPKAFGRVYPVGRLDKDSRGLIILTNDGELCHRLTHPRFEVEKEYAVWVRGKVPPAALSQLTRGMREGHDTLKVTAASIRMAKPEKTKLHVSLAEGKKRHLRRLFGALGFPVIDLKRIRIGNVRLGQLKEGTFQTVPKKTLYRLATGSSRQ